MFTLIHAIQIFQIIIVTQVLQSQRVCEAEAVHQIFTPRLGCCSRFVRRFVLILDDEQRRRVLPLAGHGLDLCHSFPEALIGQ